LTLVGEAELSGLDAFVHCLLKFKYVDAVLAGGASEQEQGGVENYALDVCFAVASLQLLHHVSSVSAEKFDNVPSTTGRSQQGSFWIDCNSPNFRVVRRNE